VLDVLTWSASVKEERISQGASAAPKSAETHSLIGDVLGQDRREIYGLALRFLGHPGDAKDASQEILVRLVTNCSRSRGRSGGVGRPPRGNAP
jgi:Sigma-70 region 2